jgi:hypothetical protein
MGDTNTNINEKNKTDDDEKNIVWSPENELMLVEWCDIAQCYKWLSNRCHEKYLYYHAWFTIPTIIFSTITGTAAFGQSNLPDDLQKSAIFVLGTINIGIGILTTLQQYLKITELKEGYRVASLGWDKYSRNIKIELSKSPNERMDAGHFIKINRHDLDKLMEDTPLIPQSVIDEFMIKFSGNENSSQRQNFLELRKPDICNNIVSSNITRHHWSKNMTNPEQYLNYTEYEEQLRQQKKQAEEEQINNIKNSYTNKKIYNYLTSSSPSPTSPIQYKKTNKNLLDTLSNRRSDLDTLSNRRSDLYTLSNRRSDLDTKKQSSETNKEKSSTDSNDTLTNTVHFPSRISFDILPTIVDDIENKYEKDSIDSNTTIEKEETINKCIMS